MELLIGTTKHTVNLAPVGLLMLDDHTIICKSEYYAEDGNAECIIVRSGENYCGGDISCVSLLID